MKDIPLFITEFGTASLALQQIPYRQSAYIRLHTTPTPEQLLVECVSFCRACGARNIFATGDAFLEKYPLDDIVMRFTCAKERLPLADAALFPVLPETLAQWQQIYNKKMSGVIHAAYMDKQEAQALLYSGEGYFIHREGVLLGIGKASAGKIDALAATAPHCGKAVLLALATLTQDGAICLEVSKSNRKAIGLYEALGFLPVGEVVRWYRIS